MANKESAPQDRSPGGTKEWGRTIEIKPWIGGPNRIVSADFQRDELTNSAALGQGLTRRGRSSQVAAASPRPGKPKRR